MMSRNKVDSGKKKISLSSLASNNKVVFLFSLILAVVFWCILSMSETTEAERVFQDVIVKISMDGSLPEKNELEIFGQSEFKVNVTVKGLSYIVNDPDFGNDDISVTASCSGVFEPGIHKLPLSVSLTGNYSSNVEVINVSNSDIEVSFDKRETKSFQLQEEIIELDGFSIGENITKENPLLSSENVVITGPSTVLARIKTVKARVELNSELTQKLSVPAEIVALSASGTVVDLTDCTIEGDGVNVIIPVKKLGTFTTAVEFTNVPPAYRDIINYSINPAAIDVRVDVNSDTLENIVVVGKIDFSELKYGVNRIIINNEELLSDIQTFEVTVDMTGLAELWKSDIPVVLTDVEVPDNITVVDSTVDSVRIICPPELMQTFSAKDIYCKPIFDGSTYEPGTYEIPVKFIFRELENCWVFGEYFVTIQVK